MQGRRSFPANEGRVVATRYAPRFSPRLLLDIIVSPIRALNEVRDSGRWLEAFVFSAVCTLASFWLTLPASKHLLAAMPSGDLKNSNVGPAPIAFAAAAALAIIGPPVLWVIEAAVLQLAVRLGKGETSLPRLFALLANTSVPATIGVLVVGIGVSLHDPNTFHSATDVYLSVPVTAAALIHRTPQEVDFFTSYGIFNVWGYVLLGIGLVRGAKVSPLVATLTLVAISFGIALARTQFK